MTKKGKDSADSDVGSRSPSAHVDWVAHSSIDATDIFCNMSAKSLLHIQPAGDRGLYPNMFVN